MANHRLTWREVSAPQMDTRGLAQAGQSITGAFDRLGQMLINREETKRTEATDSALAKMMAMGNPEEVAAYLAKAGQGGMDPRVNMRALMESGRAYEAQRVQADTTNQQRLDILDRVAQAPDVANLYRVGSTEGVTPEQLAAAQAGISDSRNAGEYMKEYTDIFDQTRGREQTGARDKVDASYKIESLANDGQRIAIDRQRAAGEAMERSLRMRTLQEAEAERREAEKIMPRARAMADHFSKGTTTLEDAVTTAMKTPTYRNLKTEGAREALLNEIKGTLGANYGLTSNDIDDGTKFSLRRLQETAAGSAERIGGLKEAAERNYNINKPGLAIATRAAGIKVAPTEQSLAKIYEGMDKKPVFMQYLMDGVRSGRVDPRVAQVVTEDFVNGFLDGGGARATSLMELGTKEFLDRDNPNSTMSAFSRAMAPLANHQKILKDLEGDAARERAQFGRVTEATWLNLQTALQNESEVSAKINATLERTTGRKRGGGTPAKTNSNRFLAK